MTEKKYTREEVLAMIEPYLNDENMPDRNIELLCGVTLLIEACLREKELKELKELAEGVPELLIADDIDSELKLNALGRIIYTLESTPWHFILRRLLEYYVLIAVKMGRKPDSYRKEAEKIVKLDILLEPEPFDERDEEINGILAELFTSRELIEFISNPCIGYLKVDRVEYTYRWETVIVEVEKRLDEMLKDVPRGMGFCFHYWNAKENLLRDEYGIQWNSPAVMNPGVMFD